jgi:putative transposase
LKAFLLRETFPQFDEKLRNELYASGVFDRFEFESIYHAQLVIERYYKWYNEERRHRSLKGQTPDKVWKKYNPIPFENEKLLNYL